MDRTLVTPVDGQYPDIETLALAAQVIRDGGLVAFPTETVYGLGANALDQAAVARIFVAKGRPANDPIIAHIAHTDQLTDLAISIPALAYELASAFWPGPLTLVLRKQASVPSNLTANNATVAVRMPAHPVASFLIQESGVPIGAPSANRFSRPSPTSALHVLADLDGRVDVVLDGGAATIGLESTIVDLTQAVPTVLRPGGIDLEALRAVMPTLALSQRMIAADDSTPVPAPGTLAKHYAPDASLIVIRGDAAAARAKMLALVQTHTAQGEQVGLLLADGDALAFEGLPVQIMLLGPDVQAMAANLFAGLRALDASSVDVILVRAPEQTGIGLAVWDRLQRAAQGHIIEV